MPALAIYVVASEPVIRPAQRETDFSKRCARTTNVSVRLEKNEAAAAGAWVLPRIDFPQAKGVRGDIGVVGAPGYRIVTGTTDS